jgi:hypothetical protein
MAELVSLSLRNLPSVDEVLRAAVMRWPDALTNWLLTTGNGDTNGQAEPGTAHHARATATFREAAS